MFKDQFPAIWRAAMEHRRKRGLYVPTEGDAQAAIDASVADMLAALKPAPTKAPLAQPAPPGKRGMCVHVNVTVSDGDTVAIRIARDGDAITATIDLDLPATLDEAEAGAR